MISIPSDKYKHDLIEWLVKISLSSGDKSAIDLLLRILKLDVVDRHDGEKIYQAKFSREEIDLILESKWCESENLQLKAYCLDIISRYNKGTDRLNYLKAASDTYFLLAEQTRDYHFLLRSITVRKAKSLYDNQFLEQIIGYIRDLLMPFWMADVAKELKKSYSLEQLRPLCDILENQITQYSLLNEYNKEQVLLDALFELEHLSKQEYFYKKSLCYEREADYNSLRQDSEYILILSLHDIYQEAFDTLYNYRNDYREDYERIRQKLEDAKSTFSRMLSTYGIRIKKELDSTFIERVKNFVETVDVSRFDLLIHECNNIPLVPNGMVDRYCEISRQTSPMSILFGSVQSDDDGLVLGKASPEEALFIEAHQHVRWHMRYIIVSLLKNFMYGHEFYSQEDVYCFLYQFCPDYINKDSLFLWTVGICAGLNDDFITASHILTPQVERALCNKAKQYNNELVHLEKEHQDQPTLGVALNILSKHMPEDVYNSIEGFLQNGADTNFRNNLLHGLLHPYFIVKNGLYLWWLALKVFFCEDELFIKN